MPVDAVGALRYPGAGGRGLDRVIPNVDVEGADLERTHPPHHAS